MIVEKLREEQLMNQVDMSQWNDSVKKMPDYLEKLRARIPMQVGDCADIPKKGIYVFYEAGNPIYTGRTNNMRTRLRKHCSPSSMHESATFAFMLAKEAAVRKGIDVNKSRKELQQDPSFLKLYDEAKARVAEMPVSFVEVDNPIEQTLFEVYASIALKTLKYNSFDNH